MLPYFRRPRTLLLITSRTLVAGTSRSNMPRSTSIVISRSVTSIVPFIGVLTNPIFAVSKNESVSPCQAFRASANRTGRISIPLNTSLNERSTDCLISSLGRSCESVILTVASYVNRQKARTWLWNIPKRIAGYPDIARSIRGTIFVLGHFAFHGVRRGQG